MRLRAQLARRQRYTGLASMASAPPAAGLGSGRGSPHQVVARLGRMQALLNRRSMDALQVQPGQRVLDLGSGQGHFACLLARAVGASGTVVGVEADRSHHELSLRRARAECPSDARPDLRRGDAGHPPLQESEWGTFDLAHARFLLERVVQPQRVVEAMLAAVRPGGRIVLEADDPHALRLWPEDPDVEALWVAYRRASPMSDGGHEMGTDLVRLAVAAGARPQRAECLSLAGCAGDARFDVLHENLVGVLRDSQELLAERDLLSASDFERGITALESWGQRDDAALWYATCWVEATRLESGT